MPNGFETDAASPSATADVLQPRVRWSQLTEAPLAGLGLAREPGIVLAWDHAHNIYLIDMAGSRLRTTRTPVPIQLAAISDDGTQLVIASKDGVLWWLDRDLQPRGNVPGHRNLLGIALSPHGELAAASMADSHTFIYDGNGRRLTNLLTHRPLRHLAFLVGQPLLVAAAEYGLAGCYELDGRPRWQDSLWSSAGHLSATGDGFAILVSCFGHGLQRYALDGTNEGAYHVGGGVARASVDYDGKTFAAATLEGEVFVLNAAGHILWRQMLPKPAKDVLIDAAGRVLIYGLETGEINLLDLFPSKTDGGGETTKPARAATEKRPAARPSEPTAIAASDAPSRDSATSALREPSWKAAAFESDEQAETSVLAVVDKPVRVAAFSNKKRVEVYSAAGALIHATEPMSGVGRYLEADAELIVGATDRQVVVYDVAGNTSARFSERLNQVSHLRIDSEAGEIVTVEERDRLSRFDLGGNRRWQKVVDSPIEGLAIGPNRTVAVTTEDGQLIVFDGERRVIGEYRTQPRESMQVVRLGSRWITLAGKVQLVRCHRVDGLIEWETRLPGEAWRLYRLAGRLVARAAGGRTFALDSHGRLLLDSSELPPESLLFVAGGDQPAAVFWRLGNLMVTDLTGQVRWRHVSHETLGPLAASAAGVACALGKQLVLFAEPDRR
jgi:hypothetical protein